VFLVAGKKHAGKQASRAQKEEKKKGRQQDAKELRETLQRVQADFENSRKRLEKEKQDFVKVAEAGLVIELLALVDSIEAAEKQVQGDELAVKGIESIKKQLLAILNSRGLEEIKSLGEKFDPMQHDCVLQGCEKEREDSIVLEEIQKGYLLNGKVLRHAKVKVNKL